MADLTRFDFNTKRFLFSERVRRMTAAEVGAYILLLAEAWMTGKDASLPDDLEYLARLGRVPQITPLLLEVLPLVDTQWGPRRQNETLYDEWLEAERRSNLGRDRVVSGRYSKEDSTTVHTTVELEKPSSSGKSWFSPTQSSTQTNPNQTKSIQSKPIQTKSAVAKLLRTQIENLRFQDELPVEETWKKCVSIWRRRKKTKLANLGSRISDFESWVDRQGSAHVLAAFDLWASELDAEFTPKFAGGMFLKNIESALEAVAINLEKEPNTLERESEDAFRVKIQQENDRQEAEQRAKEAAEAAELEATKDLI